MIRRWVTRNCCLLMLAISCILPVHFQVSAPAHALGRQELADFPTVDPGYIYNQLFFMVTHFQHHEARSDTHLPVEFNGHDAFAAYWAQEMISNLQGFGPQVRREVQPFSRSASSSAYVCWPSCSSLACWSE